MCFVLIIFDNFIDFDDTIAANAEALAMLGHSKLFSPGQKLN